jgi:hypothetical protein
MRLKTLYILFFVVTLSSCGGAKKATAGAKGNLTTKDLISSHNEASPQFNTLAGRVQVVYEDEQKLQSLTASLRMEKDKIIWIKASVLGITLAKVLITPERVSFYESIGNTYFDGNFELLSNWLGTEIDFQKAQDILLGQSIFNLKAADFNNEFVLNKYKLQPKKQAQDFIISLLLNADNFKVASETVSQPQDSRLLTVRYGDYQLIEGSYYPSEILIDTSEKESKTKIELNYKKIDLNVSVSFPFDIPEGYEEIQLN